MEEMIIGKTAEVNAEFALADVLDHIFSFLKIKDLLNAALTCKSWDAAASREMSKRGPQRLLIPHIFGKEFTDESSNFHVYDLLDSQPYVALLFVGPGKADREFKKLESEIIAKYRKFFPHFMVTIGVDDCFMDKVRVNSCPGHFGPPNGILGLFLPLYGDLNIRFKAITFSYYGSSSDLLGTLPPESTQPKTTLIFFSRPCHDTTVFLNIVKRKFKQKTYTLWGGSFDDSLQSVDCEETIREGNTEKFRFSNEHELMAAATMFKIGIRDSLYEKNDICLCITGSKHDSWSIMIDCLTERTEVDRKLLNFKSHLKLRRRSVGLACGPRKIDGAGKTEDDYAKMYTNSRELMGVVKKVLPEIQFIGVFNNGQHGHFGVDSTIDDSNQQLDQPMALSIMIMTFD